MIVARQMTIERIDSMTHDEACLVSHNENEWENRQCCYHIWRAINEARCKSAGNWQ